MAARTLAVINNLQLTNNHNRVRRLQHGLMPATQEPQPIQRPRLARTNRVQQAAIVRAAQTATLEPYRLQVRRQQLRQRRQPRQVLIQQRVRQEQRVHTQLQVLPLPRINRGAMVEPANTQQPAVSTKSLVGLKRSNTNGRAVMFARLLFLDCFGAIRS